MEKKLYVYLKKIVEILWQHVSLSSSENFCEDRVSHVMGHDMSSPDADLAPKL
jgi:glycine/serine hydroxymethyltransferase